MKRRWTEQEDRLLKELYPTEGDKGLMRRLGRSRAAVRQQATRMGLRIRACVDESYFHTWTPNMAYTLGYIWADGHIHKGGYYLAMRCHRKDEEILLKILQDMKYTNQVYYKEATTANGRNNGPQTIAHVNSVATVNVLKDLGLVHNKTYQDLPFPVVPEEFLPHFVRGYFDGDGCISVKQSRYFTLTLLATKTFATQMQERICKAVGVDPLPIREQHNIHIFVWTKLEDVKAIAKWLYPPAGDYIFLTRKREKMESVHGVVPKAHAHALKLSAFGGTWSLRSLARHHGLDHTSLGDFIRRGMTAEDAVATCLRNKKAR